jgi:hypothetical protein
MNKTTTMKIKYKIKPVKLNVFAVVVPDDYDRAMLFCRAQEYYESPNKKFRGKDFSIWDYMKWYNNQYGRGFSYGADWSGFNIPFDIVWNCYQSNDMETPYDEIMWDILGEIDNKMDINKKAYIIGVDSLDSETFNHEIAHGLYYTNKQYKELMDEVTLTISTKNYQTFRNNLIEMGYTDSVINDEIQAYLSTNWKNRKFMNGVSSQECKELHKKYKNIFSNF